MPWTARDRRAQGVDALILHQLQRIEATAMPADRALKTILQKHPAFSNAERKRVATGILGVRCWERLLAYRLGLLGLPWTARFRLAAYQRLFEAADWPDLGARLGLTAAESACLKGLDETPRWPRDPAEALSVRASLPLAVAQRLVKERGLEDSLSLMAALNQPAMACLRANRAQNSRAALQLELSETGMKTRATPLAEDGLWLTERADIRGNPAFRRGAFEVQDEGSQLIAEAVAAKAGDRVLDLCAGSGGKSLAILSRVPGVRLTAADVNPDRLADLKRRLQKVGAPPVRLCQLQPEVEAQALDGDYDWVLVDAPCSAIGSWRRGPDRKWQLNPERLPAFQKLQIRLCELALSKRAPGGRVIYATCTLLHGENQGVIQTLLARHSGLSALPPLPRLWPKETEVELRPDRHGCDGFFVAAMGLDSREARARKALSW